MKKHASIKLFLTLALLIPIVGFVIFFWYQANEAKLPFYGANLLEVSSPENAAVVSHFRFKDENNHFVDQQFTKGKVWVANTFFSNCKTVCPITMPNLTKVQTAFRDDSAFRIVSFTVDPDRDSTSQLLWYAQQLGVDTAQWHLLTGTKYELYGFDRKQLFITASDGDGGVDDFIHSDKFVLIDQQGRIRGYYNGRSSFDTQLLIKDIRKLL